MSPSFRNTSTLTTQSRNFVITLFACFLLMSFGHTAQAQGNSKEAKRELRKQERAKKRAAAQKKREAALYAGDSDFYDEDEENLAMTNVREAPAIHEEIVDATIEKPAADETEYAILSTELQLEQYAYTLKGIPYRYGGMDEKGFDCSGFTCHIFSETGVAIPRTAQAQYDAADNIPLRKARKGDLLFFGKGKRNISHVGMVISAEGEPLRMIHSASSGGIMVTELESSKYWKSRLQSAGRYLDKRNLRAAR